MNLMNNPDEVVPLYEFNWLQPLVSIRIEEARG
jgi:hypothetical protein